MKKLLVLFVSFISLTINSQEKVFGQWEFFESKASYILRNVSGIGVKNCEYPPWLVVKIFKESGTGLISLVWPNGAPFPSYEGDDVKVEVKYRNGDGSFSNGYQDENLKIIYNSITYDDVELFHITQFSYNETFTVDFFTQGLSDEWAPKKQVYFKTTLNEESKVFRFYLDGYKDAYDYFEERYDENIDPFE